MKGGEEREEQCGEDNGQVDEAGGERKEERGTRVCR